MCFITYWTGCSTNDVSLSRIWSLTQSLITLFFQGFPSQTIRKKKVDKRDLIEKYYKVVPIHKRHDLVDETIKLINFHWPKSRSERLSILGSSKDTLPMSLIVTFKRKESDPAKESQIMNDIFFNRKSADAPTICSQTGKPINVLGHLRLVPVPADDKACFIESMVIHQDFRGKGIGSYFIHEAEKFCEQVLHLKSLFLSTYDSGEFYMKIGFQLTSAICVYGNGEVNTVTKKIFLKKDLNYVEPEVVEETPEEVYNPNKDYNYKQQQAIETDVILSGFPFKMERSVQGVVAKLCQVIGYEGSLIKYFYTFEFLNRKTGRRSFHMIISTSSVDAKTDLLAKLKGFGVLCFQNFFEKPVNEYDNTLITHDLRYTNLNYVIKKDLQQLKEDKWISDFKYENFQFHAKQNDEWIVVKNLEVVEILKTPELPDVPDEEIIGWDVVEEEDRLSENLEKFRQHFRSQAAEDWWPTLRRPSEIVLEPLEPSTKKLPVPEIESTSIFQKVGTQTEPTTEATTSWVSSLQSCNDAITMGLSINEF